MLRSFLLVPFIFLICSCGNDTNPVPVDQALSQKMLGIWELKGFHQKSDLSDDQQPVAYPQTFEFLSDSTLVIRTFYGDKMHEELHQWALQGREVAWLSVQGEVVKIDSAHFVLKLLLEGSESYYVHQRTDQP